jgi:hypothetical protein
MVIWNILRPFDIFYDHLVIYVVTIWYIFPRFGILCQEKSGSPALAEWLRSGIVSTLGKNIRIRIPPGCKLILGKT